MPKNLPKTRADRVVRYVRKSDGVTVEKRYAAWTPDPARALPGELTLADLIGAYERSPEWRNLKLISQTAKARAFNRASRCMNVPLSKFTKGELMNLRDQVSANFGDGAARDFAQNIAALFSWAEERGTITENPARKLLKGLQKGEWPTWTDQQYERAIAWPDLPERTRRAIVLARWTGQRVGDLVKMDWSDIYNDPQGGMWIHVTQDKSTGKRHEHAELELPVSTELAAELQAWRAECKVFDRRGNPIGTILTADSGKPWQQTNLSAQVSNHLDKIPNFPKHLSLHGLRKFMLTDLAMKGASVHVIQSISGHKTLAMVQHYTHKAEQKRGATIARRFLDGTND